MKTDKAKGRDYENWAKKYILKHANQTFVLHHEMGFDSPEAMKQKGEAGEYLTTNPPYGYTKDSDNPKSIGL